MSSPEVSIAATVSGECLGRERVLAWEERRITAAAKRLCVAVPTNGDVASRRESLLKAKLDLGSEAIIERLRRDIRISGPLARVEAAMTPRRRTSVTHLTVHGGTAQDFVDWFHTQTAKSNEPAMLRACPDHFVIRTGSDGRQEVIETTGGSPLATQFFIDYDGPESPITPADSDYPHQIAGVALASTGRSIGGVRHQFRNTSAGFDAHLTVEFPLPTLPVMVSQHRWHLACEFSNWIEAAFS
jgi:hypothetical protein